MVICVAWCILVVEEREYRVKQGNIIPVPHDLIDRGITAYGGVMDDEIQNLLDHAGLPYRAYLFRDGRILLVYAINETTRMGFLYPSKEVLFAHLDLES